MHSNESSSLWHYLSNLHLENMSIKLYLIAVIKMASQKLVFPCLVVCLLISGAVFADQEANEFHRGYYDGRRGHGRGRRSADEKEIFTEVLNADQDASAWYDRGYYGFPYSYGRYGYSHSYYW